MRKPSEIAGLLVGVMMVAALVPGPAMAQDGAQALAVEGPAEQAVPPPTAVSPGEAPKMTLPQWTAQKRKLKIQLGVSAGFTAAFLVTGVLLFALPIRCPADPEIDCEPYGRWIAGLTMIPATVIAGIPTAVFGVRLYRHNKRQPVAQLQLAPGGLALRF